MNPLLNHKIYGEDRPGMPPLIIMHGLFGMLDNWSTIAKELSTIRQIHCLDLRNHGRSFHHPEMNYPTMADDVLDYIDRQGLDEVQLLGHSMGGKVALEITRRYPYVVQRLIVADMSMRAYPIRHGAIIEALKKLSLDSASSRNELQLQLRRNLEAPIGVIQFLLKSVYRTDDGQYALRFNLEAIDQHMNRIVEGIPFEEAFDNPVLYLRGIRSDYVLDEDLIEAKKWFKHFQHKDLVAGHWLHAEKREDFTQEVASFIA